MSEDQLPQPDGGLRGAFRLGACRVDPTRLQVTAADGQARALSKRQMSALLELVHHQGAVVSRARLHAILCHAAEGHRDRAALSHHVAAIRRALGDPQWLETVRGQGYSLRVPPEIVAPRAEHGGRAHPRPARSPAMWFATAALSVVFALVLVSDRFARAPVLTTSVASDPHRSDVLFEALSAGARRRDGTSRASADALERARTAVLDDAFLTPSQKSARLMPIAEGLMCLQDWPRSSDTFEQLLALERSAPAPDPHTMARALTGLARVTSVVTQSIEGSRALLVEAAQWARRDAVNDLQRVQLWSAHAGLMAFGQDLVRADALLADAIRVLDRQAVPDRYGLLQLKTRRVGVLTARGDFEAATALVRRLRADTSEWLDDEDARLAPLLSAQGHLLEAQQEYGRAADLYARVVANLEAQYSDADSPLIHARLALARVLSRAGNANTAVDLYRRVIDHVQAKDATNVIGLNGLHVDLSSALLAASQPQRAYELIRQVLAALDGRHDAPDWMRYAANSVYGAALIELGRCDEGLQHLDETLDDMLLHGVDDPRITDDILARRARYEGSRCRARDKRA